MHKDVFLIALRTHAVHGDINNLPHEACQLCNVDARSAINLWRILLRKYSGFHSRQNTDYPQCALNTDGQVSAVVRRKAAGEV